MKPLYEIVNLGVHHPDYFQWFGTSFTQFAYSTYGIGDTAEEAYQCAREQMELINGGSELGGTVSAALLAMPEHCPFAGSVPAGAHGECYSHVGILWNEEGEAP